VKVISSIIENKFLKIKTLNIGATLFEVYYKFKKINLILNLGSKENYKFKNFCVGSTCGRYAGRIGNSKFFIGKKKFVLSKNDGKNTLHGGKIGFDRLVWKKINHTKDKIVYQITSKHLDEGFPGNLTVNCSYKILKNKLLIQYTYKSDQPTHVNLTNHSYWNLNKNKVKNIFNHDLKINSDKFLEVDKFLIPNGKITNVKNSIYDFKKFSNIKNKIDLLLNKKKLKKTNQYGFDTTYSIIKSLKNYVATLRNKKNEIKLDFFSNLPGVQLYTGHRLKYKKKLKPFQGICLETQYYPDTPNKKNFPSTLIKPNKRYTSFTKIVVN
jgi:aldose 1-epimerase